MMCEIEWMDEQGAGERFHIGARLAARDIRQHP